jgi:catechol 2,3-dioxygenase-like lactoylglutathione lyase family enzyme
MLSKARVRPTIPASDLDRARAYYSDSLGLKPAEEQPGGLVYECAEGSNFLLFQSSGVSNGGFTQISFEVDDVNSTVKDLQSRGVKFEEYDFPGLKTVNGIAEIAIGKGAWFKDSEGNLLAVAQRVEVPAKA